MADLLVTRTRLDSRYIITFKDWVQSSDQSSGASLLKRLPFCDFKIRNLESQLALLAHKNRIATSTYLIVTLL
jgi:hypothetical protein